MIIEQTIAFNPPENIEEVEPPIRKLINISPLSPSILQKNITQYDNILQQFFAYHAFKKKFQKSELSFCLNLILVVKGVRSAVGEHVKDAVTEECILNIGRLMQLCNLDSYTREPNFTFVFRNSSPESLLIGELKKLTTSVVSADGAPSIEIQQKQQNEDAIDKLTGKILGYRCVDHFPDGISINKFAFSIREKTTNTNLFQEICNLDTIPFHSDQFNDSVAYYKDCARTFDFILKQFHHSFNVCFQITQDDRKNRTLIIIYEYPNIHESLQSDASAAPAPPVLPSQSFLFSIV